MSKQLWLITGGAGYIGSHVADTFLANGKDVVLYDSLYQGLESRVDFLRSKYKQDIPLVIADIRDYAKFEEILATYKPYGIIHSAALKAVGESIEKPDEYFDVNYTATAKILELATKHGIHHFIFSSTAAVYGAPDHSNSIKEDDPKNPISPYGASKLKAEYAVEKYLGIPGNFGTSLRFFNVIGTAEPELTDNSVENLAPIVINKLKTGEPPVIYGADYPTPDETCIRDYVDVRDIASAHLLVSDSNKILPFVMNVGTGHGRSVREVITIVMQAMARTDVKPTTTNRRLGDPPLLCADVSLIEKTLGYRAKYSLVASIASLV